MLGGAFAFEGLGELFQEILQPVEMPRGWDMTVDSMIAATFHRTAAAPVMADRTATETVNRLLRATDVPTRRRCRGNGAPFPPLVVSCE